MRTTIDIPSELHSQALAIARDTSSTLSEVVSKLMRRGLQTESVPCSTIPISTRTGFPIISIGHVITSEDVRSLEDDE